jgi:hypothetical protein
MKTLSQIVASMTKNRFKNKFYCFIRNCQLAHPLGSTTKNGLLGHLRVNIGVDW